MKILPPNRSNNADKLHLLKKYFLSSWRSSNGIEFLKKCCTAKEQQRLYCKYCAINSTSFVNCVVGKNRQKLRKLVIEPLCSF